MTEIQNKLFELRDEKYADFQGALIPNIEKERIIGVRTPDLRSLAREIYKSGNAEEFINSLPHRYFEENQLHAFIVAEEKDFGACLEEVNRFLPYIDNWATCDQLSPKCFYKNREKLKDEITRWITGSGTYEVRFGIISYMRYFLGDNFKYEYAERVSEIKREEYYIRMAIAWYFATALAKNWEEVFPIVAEKRLDSWVHNKTIQKAVESYRISGEQKKILKELRIG